MKTLAFSIFLSILVFHDGKKIDWELSIQETELKLNCEDINTIDGIVKHNGPNYLVKENLDLLPNLNKIKKINFYNQSSLESQISALSDDIAYNNHDIDDGIRAGLFSINDIKDLPIIGEIIKKKNKQFKNEKLLRNEIIRSIINFMVTDLILNTKKKLKN